MGSSSVVGTDGSAIVAAVGRCVCVMRVAREQQTNERSSERDRDCTRLHRVLFRLDFSFSSFPEPRGERRVSQYRSFALSPTDRTVRLFVCSGLRLVFVVVASRRPLARAPQQPHSRSPTLARLSLPPSGLHESVGCVCARAHGRPSTIWPRPRRCFAALRRSRRVCTRSRSACSNASLPPRVRRGAPTRSALHDTHSRLSECARVCVVRLYVQRRSMRTANSARACSTTLTS